MGRGGGAPKPIPESVQGTRNEAKQATKELSVATVAKTFMGIGRAFD